MNRAFFRAGWVALGEDGSVFVTEANEKGVLELSAYGTPRRRIGGAEEAQRDVLKGAQGIAVAGDRLFVADSEAHLVAVYSLASGARVWLKPNPTTARHELPMLS